jgi:hypothetical protein
MHYNFIEIGTADFHTEIEKASNETRGLSIEPVLYYLNKLPTKPLVHKVLSAISDQDGWTSCYYIPEHYINRYFPGQWELKGNNSINTYHPQAKAIVEAANLDPAEIFSVVQIPMYSFATMADMYQVTSIDLLKTDTEGHDCIIMNNYIRWAQAKNCFAKEIVFETHHLTPSEMIDQTIQNLQSVGYSIIERGMNTTMRKD